MPPHRVYIEPFLGWAAIMKAKLPADRNIGIDINPERIAEAKRDIASAEVTIGDGLRFLETFRWRGGELVYCDPPYLLETRTSNCRYDFEISDHTRLLRVLSMLPCPVMLSGYHSTLYDEVLRTWRMVEYKAPTRAGWRTEVLWCNFPEPLELHDYRYLGSGFRERQNIKRKIQRWSKKLAAMPMLERRALMAAIQNTK
jgi:site-specific DNA-adenine methylase